MLAENWGENGIIVVTVNHRIGSLGLLRDDVNDIHGNYALHDIVTALKV